MLVTQLVTLRSNAWPRLLHDPEQDARVLRPPLPRIAQRTKSRQPSTQSSLLIPTTLYGQYERPYPAKGGIHFGTVVALGGHQWARIPQKRRFRAESGALAHVQTGNCTEVDTPFRQYVWLGHARICAVMGGGYGLSRCPQARYV